MVRTVVWGIWYAIAISIVIAGIAFAVFIGIFLIRIRYARAIVGSIIYAIAVYILITHIAYTISVKVGLVGVRGFYTIIKTIDYAIAINIAISLYYYFAKIDRQIDIIDRANHKAAIGSSKVGSSGKGIATIIRNIGRKSMRESLSVESKKNIYSLGIHFLFIGIGYIPSNSTGFAYKPIRLSGLWSDLERACIIRYIYLHSCIHGITGAYICLAVVSPTEALIHYYKCPFEGALHTANCFPSGSRAWVALT